MTNKNAMEEITERICMKCKYLLYAEMCTRCFYQKSLDALKAADEYRWHDLKKKPDDLPKENGRYRIVYLDGDEKHYFEIDFRIDCGFGYECVDWHDELIGSTPEYYFETVDEGIIAWQEIAYFEEEK